MSTTELAWYRGSITEYFKTHDWKSLICKEYNILASCFRKQKCYLILEYHGEKKLAFLSFFKQNNTILYNEEMGMEPTKAFLKAVEAHFDDASVKDWVHACRETEKRRKSADLVEDGKYIEFEDNLHFRRKDGSAFTKNRFFVWSKRRNLFHDNEYGLCHIPGWRTLGYKIIK